MINWLMLKLYKFCIKTAAYIPQDDENFKPTQFKLEQMRVILDKRGINYND